MNLFQLVIKQMRQRALSTWLTLLSVMLGVALAIAIMILRREGAALFGQRDFGYDVIIGAKGSPLQLTLNTVYHIDQSPGNISYSFYEKLIREQAFRADVRIAVPTAVGDSYKGRRIVGTSTKLFGIADDGTRLPPERTLEYKTGKRYEIAEGRVFSAQKFEAVIGADVTRLTGLKLGGTFQAAHGLPKEGQTPDIHEATWTVVGILKRTGTAADGVLFIPLTSFYCIAEHDVGLVAGAALREGKSPAAAIAEHEAQQKKDDHEGEHKHEGEDHNHDEPAVAATAPADSHDDHDHGHDHGEADNYTVAADGTIDLKLPKEVWGLSAILVKARAPFSVSNLLYSINNGRDAAAVNPASVMREFFKSFLSGTTLMLLLIAILVSIVASVGILVSIYNSVSARLREIAILRALGATRRKVLLLICVEAALIGLIGGALGVVCGHLLAAAGSVYLNRLLGEGIAWFRVDRWELIYLGVVVVIAVIAGLVPALKAYRTPVATNLVSG